jgi:hypothetical protein
MNWVDFTLGVGAGFVAGAFAIFGGVCFILENYGVILRVPEPTEQSEEA